MQCNGRSLCKADGEEAMKFPKRWVRLSGFLLFLMHKLNSLVCSPANEILFFLCPADIAALQFQVVDFGIALGISKEAPFELRLIRSTFTFCEKLECCSCFVPIMLLTNDDN